MNKRLLRLGLVAATGLATLASSFRACGEATTAPTAGDGTWSLRLHGAAPMTHPAFITPVDLVLERRGGGFVAGLASATLATPLPGEVDWSGLKVADGCVTGKVTVAFPAADTRPAATLATAVEARVEDGAISGTHLVDAKLPRGQAMAKQAVTGAIGPPAPLPARWFIELGLYWGQDEYAPILLRLLVEEGRVAQSAAYRSAVEGKPPVTVPGDSSGGQWEIKVREANLHLAGRELAVKTTLEAAMVPGSPSATFELKGAVIGLRAAGRLSAHPDGGQPIAGTFLGRLLTGDVLPPVSLGSGRRTWALDAKPEEDLIAQAQAESLMPIRPGEPGKQEFWTWRIIKRQGSTRFIYPPSFSFTEVEEAKSYRFTVAESLPPLPLPVLKILPSQARKNGMAPVPLEVGRLPTQWLVAANIESAPDQDPLAPLGGLTGCQPAEGTTFTVKDREHVFAPLEARFPGQNRIGLAALSRIGTRVCLFTLLENGEPRYVRARVAVVGRGSFDVALAGKLIVNGQVLRLEKGLYPLAAMVHLRGSVQSLAVVLDAAAAEEAQAVEDARANPPKAKGCAFEADKPWRPLAPIWKDLPPGAYQVRVEALDAKGRPMEALPRWRFYGRICEGLKEQFEEHKTISFTKYPSFQGPYSTAPRSYRQAALMAARADREQPSLCGTRRLCKVHETFAGGDHGVQREIPGALFPNSLLARLSPSPIERREALDLAGDMGLAIRIAAGRFKTGVPNVYQCDLPITYRLLEGFLDLRRDTGDEQWAKAALSLGESLVRVQEPSGAWRALDQSTGKTRRPGGFFGSDAEELDPSLILWQLGRLRHDLKTDRFLDAERKAYEYVMTHTARTMEWPELGYHSLPLSYPYAMAGNTTIAFVRYLLDYAEPEQRDLGLAEELLRWCEDRHIDWTRPPEIKPGDAIRPTSHGSCDGYRSSGHPARMAVQQALGWLKLYGHSGEPLHRAKAEALANAVLLAQDPAGGNINIGLAAANPSFNRFADNYGETARELDEFAALWEHLHPGGGPGGAQGRDHVRPDARAARHRRCREESVT